MLKKSCEFCERKLLLDSRSEMRFGSSFFDEPNDATGDSSGCCFLFFGYRPFICDFGSRAKIGLAFFEQIVQVM